MVHRSSPVDAPFRSLQARSGVGDAAQDEIVTIDAQMRIVMVNAVAERMFERRSAELLGRELMVRVPERLRGQHAANLRQFIEFYAVKLAAAQRGLTGSLWASGEEFLVESALCKVDRANGQRYVQALRACQKLCV